MYANHVLKFLKFNKKNYFILLNNKYIFHVKTCKWKISALKLYDKLNKLKILIFIKNVYFSDKWTY